MLQAAAARERSGQSFGLDSGPGALQRNVRLIADGASVGCDVGALIIERDLKELHRDLFFDSFSVGLGAASLETRNRDRERVGMIPGLGSIYRDQLVYAGAVLRRFVESYVVDVKFDLDVVIDGVVRSFDNILDVIVKNTTIFGGEWIFDPNTESDDGLFELVPVTGRRDFGTKIIGGLRRSPVGVDDLSSLGFVHEPAIGSKFALRCAPPGNLPRRSVKGGVPAVIRYYIESSRAPALIVRASTSIPHTRIARRTRWGSAHECCLQSSSSLRVPVDGLRARGVYCA